MNYIVESNRVYTQNDEGKLLAEIRFPENNGVATITRTFVDPSLRGQGVAEQLILRALTQIQKSNWQIAATCSYAVAWLQRHPEHPVVNTGEGPSCAL